MKNDELLAECTIYLAEHYKISAARIHKLLLKESTTQPRKERSRTRDVNTLAQLLKPERKSGRPMTVRPAMRANLLREVEQRTVQFRSEGKRVTDKAVIEAILKENGYTPRDLKALTQYFVKQVSKARNPKTRNN